MDSRKITLAGKFYVLAQLTQRDFVTRFTPSTTEGVDISSPDNRSNRWLTIEVKTTHRALRKAELFSDEPCFVWVMQQRHEDAVAGNLFYCFVALQDTRQLPRFFVVPSNYVATYVREQHRYWLRTREKKVAVTSLRHFSIPVSDPLGFENDWAALTRKTLPARHRRLAESWSKRRCGA